MSRLPIRRIIERSKRIESAPKMRNSLRPVLHGEAMVEPRYLPKYRLMCLSFYFSILNDLSTTCYSADASFLGKALDSSHIILLWEFFPLETDI